MSFEYILAKAEFVTKQINVVIVIYINFLKKAPTLFKKESNFKKEFIAVFPPQYFQNISMNPAIFAVQGETPF